MRNDVYQPTASEHADEELPMELKPKIRVPLLWKILVGVLILIIIIMMIALIIQGKKLGAKKCKSNCPKVQSSALGYKDDLDLPEDASVFQDLSDKELKTVRDFMLNQKALGLTKVENAKLTDNFIVLIEHLMAPKAEVLNYLDKGGQKPVRRARVIISEGKSDPAVTREYVVEGLPNPTKYTELKFDGVKSPISFERRIFTSIEKVHLTDVLGKAAREAYQVLKESFGYWYENCTDHCLSIVFNGIPATSQIGERKFWAPMFRRVPGAFLRQVPFQLRIDVTSKNTSMWNVDQVMYNSQQFSTVAVLLEKYRAGSINKIKIPVLTEDQIMRSSARRRPSLSNQRPTEGPTFVEPDGKRFVVQGRKVTFKDWTFHISMRSSGGLALYDVRFRNERIIYELSVQEGASFYSGNAPQASSSYYLDSTWGLGWSTFSLKKDFDCPKTATFLDVFNFFADSGAQKLEDAICVFELNTGQASRRHIEFKTSKDGKKVEGLWFMEGMLDRAIVVRSVSTPYNYDYTFDYILHENGVIEVRTAASGYAIHTHYNTQEDRFGFKTTTDALGLIHDHFILHKVDLDVAGTANSFQTLDISPSRIPNLWEPGSSRVYKTIIKSVKEREQEALMRYNFDQPKYYTMINQEKKNTFGTPRGYRISPINMAKQVFPDDYFPVPAASWTKYQIAVTKRKDSEPFGSSLFNQFSMRDPTFDFDSMIKDNEDIKQQDLVAWVNTGCLHIPNTEDIPMTTTPGAVLSFVLKPYGYFDEDPSMSSQESFYYENTELP